MSRGPVTILVALVAPAVVAWACTDGGIVGGECLPGACGSGGGHPDGATDGATDGAADGALDASEDGSTDGAPWDGSADRDGPDDDAGDGGPSDGGPGDGGDACTPPYVTPSQCGDCFTQCVGATPLCSPVDGGHACVPLCDPPLVACNGQCVDLNNDPMHCGACNNQCPSGICQSGQCVGAVVGHLVTACMNYEQSFQNAPQTLLLGNAVFLPLADPVRILAYHQHTPANVRNRVNQTIGWAAQAKNRTFSLTTAATPAAVLSQLSILSFDVLLVYDQPNAPAGALGPAGASWQTAVDQFSKAGGVVVALASDAGVNAMPALLSGAGILAVSAVSAHTGTLYNKAPADAVGVNVLSPFASLTRTCTLTTSDPAGPTTVYVVGDTPGQGQGAPVVVHRIQAP